MKRKIHEREGGHEAKSRPRYKAAMHPEVLDAGGAAKVLGVSKSLVLRLARAGKAPAKKIGKEWRFRLSTLLRWLGQDEARSGEQRLDNLEPGSKEWVGAMIKAGRAELVQPGKKQGKKTR